MKKRDVLELIESSLVSLGVIVVIFMLVASVETISGPSMEPNFFSGEKILIDKISVKQRTYQRGDIVVFTPPNEPNKHYIKRIIGTPKDLIKVFECKIFISTADSRYILEEPYLAEDTCTNAGPELREGRLIELKENEYVLMGDNRDFSLDSRVFGPVDENALIGHVIFRFWPIKRAGFI